MKTCELYIDGFLSKHLNGSVYHAIIDNEIDFQVVKNEIDKAIINKPVLIYCRLKGDSLYNELLRSYGFYKIETSVQYLYSSHCKIKETLQPNYSFSVNDLNTIGEISKHSFIYDRFHVDSNISNELASNIKQAWSINNCTGRAHQVFIERVKNEIVGFCTTVQKDASSTVIDLIAVHPQFQGQHIGERLLRSAIDFYRGQVKKIIVGTQANNLPSRKLYQKVGFAIHEQFSTYHWSKISPC